MASSQPGDSHPVTDNDEHPTSVSKETEQPPPERLPRPADPAPILLPSSSDVKNNSKTTSREHSPSKTPTVASQPAAPRSRSRKNSHDLSPNRSISTQLASTPSVPSAAALQRALFANNNKAQQPSPNIDGAFDPKGDQTHPVKSSESSPHWPRSPRLTSPPPKASSRIPQSVSKKAESEPVPPNTSLKRMAVAPPTLHVRGSSDEDLKDLPGHLQSPKTSAGELTTSRPVLPTVVESDHTSASSAPPRQSTSQEQKASNVSSKPDGSDSGPDSADKRPTTLRPSTSDLRVDSLAPNRPAPVLPKRSLTSLNLAKSKTIAEPPLRSMTVETETVSSVPQVSLGVGGGERGPSGRSDAGGSLRAKPSVETIRPKKEKKRTARKQPSINAGTVSSKADIFEAKVASAVDEANSSDSDETFVYESNPHESQPSRAYRHHSRTPSATSMASVKDLYPNRYSKPSAKEGNQGVAGKRSMKFASTHHNNLDIDTGGQGSIRTDGRNGQATPRHHHFGRHGRAGHTSIFDNESPFTQNKVPSPKTPYGNGVARSRPNSPRIASYRVTPGTRKSEGFAYENDEEAADDERAPLIGSVRITRRHGRRPNSSSLRQAEYLDRRRGCMARYGACLLVSVLLFVIISMITMFVVGLTKPLVDVEIRHIKNVLASEQEIMLDLDVRATNPNLFAITVADMDVNIFAKSGYVRSSTEWKKDQEAHKKFDKSRGATRDSHGDYWKIPFVHWKPDGIDEGTDPIEDPEGDSQTMLLGRIYEFDSPLNFEPSPLRRQTTHSVGEVRLQKPGNKTEEGGSARWERVIQHPFDLIVRGVFKYQLPLSSKFKSASVISRAKVLPEDDENKSTPTDDEDPRSIEPRHNE